MATDIVTILWKDRVQDTNYRLRNGDPVTLLQHDGYVTYSKVLQSHVANELGVRETILSSDITSKVTQHLRNHLSKQEVVTKLAGILARGTGQTNLTPQYREEIVIYTARLLVMVDVGRLMSESHVHRQLPWNDGSLRKCIDGYFIKSKDSSTFNVKLPKAFNAWTIEMVGGIRIQLTDNLADHLLLTDDDGAVLIFHQASFLSYRIKGKFHWSINSIRYTSLTPVCNSSLLPDGLVEETLRTLALLFPASEFPRFRKTKQVTWFKGICDKYKRSNGIVDSRMTKCGKLTTSDRQIRNFDFWRDRLVVLKEAYDETTPRTMSQWWQDRRNGVQWYTFWVAILVLILTIFFGLVQCVEGALKVYKAYYPSR